MPNRTSATALPPSTPGNQASSIASARLATLVRASGRPFISTSTSGLPVAARRLTRCACSPGSVMSERAAASPLWPAASPTTATITSDFCAAAIASANPARLLQTTGGFGYGGFSIVQPGA